jgi:Glycosyl hydrolases family 6
MSTDLLMAGIGRSFVKLGSAAIAVAIAGALIVSTASGHAPRAHAAYAQQCPDPYPATRDASNPLMLQEAPGPNPLTGAQFFVDGPAHGAAAGAIASLLGRDPSSFPDDYSWSEFQSDLQHGSMRSRLASDPSLAQEVALLEKIAVEPDANRFSLYSGGGGPGAIFGQVQKIFCHNLTADPGTIPIITTYFLYQAGYCESKSEILDHRGTFERQVDEMADGIARRPAVMLLELDAIGASKCMQDTGALPYWEADIRYEIQKVSALPHTVVYIEGGYADSNSPRYTAKVLNAVGVDKIRGFWTNDTHDDWTINEIRWGEKVSRLTHGAHFIVNTATDGQGPLVPANRVKDGNEVLCNPPGRGIGPLPTANPIDPRSGRPFADVDAFLWTAPPGNSSGTCNGGPPSGTFWVAKALGMSALANGRLGPGWPSEPY